MYELNTSGCVRALRIKFKFLMDVETQKFSHWCLQNIFVALLERCSLREMLPKGDAPLSTRGLVSRP